MEKIIYYCDCCGKEVEYEKIRYVRIANKSKYESFYSSVFEERLDICPDCEKKIKNFMKDLKK